MDVFGKFGFTILIAYFAGFVTFLLGRVIIPKYLNDSNFISREKNIFNRYRFLADKLVLVLVCFVCLFYIVYTSLRNLTFSGGGYDVALFNQAIWNSLNGRLFDATVMPTRVSVLGTHFAPLLLALVPLYAITKNLVVLAVVQSLASATAAFPLYWFARPRIGHLLGLVIVIAYLSSPFLTGITMQGFHDILLGVIPITLSLYFLLRKRYIPFLVCAFLALLAREDLALLLIAFGAYAVFIQRKVILGLGVLGVSFSWAVLMLQIVIPQFNPAGMWIGSLYPEFGRSFLEIGFNILTRPIFTVQSLLVPEKIAFISYLLVPVALIPLFGIEVTGLATLPVLALLLTQFYLLYEVINYHPAPALPVIFFGAIIGLQRILQFRSAVVPGKTQIRAMMLCRKVALAALILSSSLVTFYFDALPQIAQSSSLTSLALNPHTAIGYDLLRRIPNQAVVGAQEELIAQVSNRRIIYVFPTVPDYRQIDYLFGDTTRFWYQFHHGAWDEVLATGYFEALSRDDGYILAQRKPLEHPLQVQFDERISLVGHTIAPTGKLYGGQTIRPILGWRAEKKISTSYIIRMALVDRQEHVWAEDGREPQNGALPTNRWIVGEFVGDQYTLPLASAMPPGDYQIKVGIYDPLTDSQLIARDKAQGALGSEIVITTLHIEKDKSDITASQLQAQYQLEQPYFVDMGELRLLGFKSFQTPISKDQVLPIGLYWRARAKPRGDYMVTVELLDADRRVALQQQSRPAAGTYPTTQWDAGEVLLDWHDLQFPPSFKPGQYTVKIILTDPLSAKVLGESSLPVALVIEP